MFKKKIRLSLFGLILLLIISFFIGRYFGIGNQKLNYGDSGLPKNCRALITENLKGVLMGHYSEHEALSSIDRNCGQNGLIWDER